MKGLLPVHGNKLHTTIQYIGKKREIWHSVCEKFQYSFPENLSICRHPSLTRNPGAAPSMNTHFCIKQLMYLPHAGRKRKTMLMTAI